MTTSTTGKPTTKQPTIVFDLDGTLVNSLPDIVRSFQHSFSVLGLPEPDDASVKKLIGKPLEDMYAAFTQQHIPELVTAYRAHYPQHFTDNSHVFPGVLELLTSLRERGYACVVATTKRTDMAQAFTNALGLTPYLNHVQGTDDFPHKPEPDVLYRAVAAVNGTGIWMVGDTTTDIQAGQAAGYKTYAVTWGTHSKTQLATVNPDKLEDTLTPLLECL